jgi:type IV secretion system protein VirB10
MVENNENEAIELEGDRGITSVTSKQDNKNAEIRKKLIVVAGIVFLGFVAFMQWPSRKEDKPNVRESSNEIKERQSFEAAEIEVVQKKPLPEPKIEPPEKIELPKEPSEAEQLLEASRRAPLMAFKGSRSKVANITDNETDGGPFGAVQKQEEQGLAARVQTTKFKSSQASVIKEPHLTITQGTIMPCTLNTAMDSSQPGLVTCTINDNIYSSTGAVILMEKGTRVTGQYKGGLKRGENRLFVIWMRAETPSGVVVNLDSSAADGLGRSGFAGDIDTQFWTRFGGTLMLSIIEDAIKIIGEKANIAENVENTSKEASSLAQTELESVINVPVILRKNQGEQVSIMLNRDLDFSHAYRLRIK